MPSVAQTVCANIAGPLEVWFAIGVPSIDGAGLTPLQLGWTMNGFDVTDEPRFSPIHDDQNGGDQGAPTGYQRFWGNHILEAEFPRYIATNSQVLAGLLRPSVANGVGADIVCGSLSFHLWLRGSQATAGPPATYNFVRHYPNCVLVDPIRESPIGSIKSILGVRLTAMFMPQITTTPGYFYNFNMSALG